MSSTRNLEKLKEEKDCREERKGVKRTSWGLYLNKLECLKNIVELATLASLLSMITEIFMTMLAFGK
jgi:bifunctional N-acetylglucosamine-1-phosphate-uridyltransferase/glucosamine-1-phosphate-acetyltransferase GlmU-like protein